MLFILVLTKQPAPPPDVSFENIFTEGLCYHN